jgi:Ca2+-binding RTX toxin-like protein
MAIITGTPGDDNNLLKDIIELGSLSSDQPKLIQEDLYFGRNIAGGGEVSEAEFQAFIDAEITPQFPDGLTVYETNGQFLDSNGNLIQEPSQVISLIFKNTLENQGKIDQITESYQQQFKQESVLEVVNEDQLIGFDESTDLIDNDPIPELIQSDLYFGRNITGGGEVSEAEFQKFLDREITPRFPDGLTVYEADGQFLDSTGKLIKEPSKVVSLIFEDTAENEAAIEQIIVAYKQQFQQESVLQIVDEEIQVAFNSDTIFVDDREPTFCGFEDSKKLIDELLRGGTGYDILLGEVGNDTLIGAQGQDSYSDTITDFIAAEQILFPVANFESMPGEASAISLDQFTLGMTAFDAGDQFLTMSSYD